MNFLQINRCHAFTDLPEGLRVSGRVYLVKCDGFMTLPRGMRVVASLSMGDCDAWDGVIPDDLVVAPHQWWARIRLHVKAPQWTSA
jgi:hypothetical protein